MSSNKLPLGKPQEAGKTCLYEARLRVDAVSGLLSRRELRHIFDTCRDSLIAASLFSDGSPVSGQEIQGMILELNFSDGRIEKMYYQVLFLGMADFLAWISASSLCGHFSCSQGQIVMLWLGFAAK